MSNIVDDFIREVNEEDSVDESSRSYSYRRQVKAKEQRRRKEIYYNRGYFPTMPIEVVGENGELFYIEGCKSNYKQHLKRVANKAVRKSPLEEVSDGKQYRKVFNLQWEWF